MALIDILWKICKVPADEVLGGPRRSRARALTALHGSSEAEWIESLRTARAGGYAAVVVPLSSPEDPIRGRGFYRRMRETLERLRESARNDVDFVLNCRETVPAAEVAELARELESFHWHAPDAPSLYCTRAVMRHLLQPSKGCGCSRQRRPAPLRPRGEGLRRAGGAANGSEVARASEIWRLPRAWPGGARAACDRRDRVALLPPPSLHPRSTLAPPSLRSEASRRGGGSPTSRNEQQT